jgi:hypothetical protein
MAQASCWSTRTRLLGPREGESVAAYCRRAVQLQSDLANANREVSQISMVESVMDGLERERPEWIGVLQCHRRLGHAGLRKLADLKRKCLLGADDPSPAAFVQARKQKACEPCVLGKLRRVPHPPRVPLNVRPLHRLHVDLGDLPHGGYLSTLLDEGTRVAVAAVLQQERRRSRRSQRNRMVRVPDRLAVATRAK